MRNGFFFHQNIFLTSLFLIHLTMKSRSLDGMRAQWLLGFDYSSVPNKRAWWNFDKNEISMQSWISVQCGILLKILKRNAGWKLEILFIKKITLFTVWMCEKLLFLFVTNEPINKSYQKINLALAKIWQKSFKNLERLKCVQSRIRACKVEVWSKLNKACIHVYSGH